MKIVRILLNPDKTKKNFFSMPFQRSHPANVQVRNRNSLKDTLL